MIAGKVVTGDNKCVISKVWRTDGIADRMKGLLTWSRLEEDQGLWIEPCSSVHTLFMKYELDLIFLDDKGAVKKTVENMCPWRITACFGARATLELSQGALSHINIKKGQSLYWKEM